MRQPIKKIANDYLKLYENNPVLWTQNVLGVHLWSKQREVIQSVFENRRTIVRASHSVGKSFTAACSVLAFLFLKTPCKVITTAPAWYQVRSLLWAEINHLFKTNLLPQKFPGEPLQTELRIADTWFAIGISPKEAVNFQGFHQKNVLIVFDEAPGVRKEIVDGADSLMASGNAHTLWIGNPTEASGHFYDAFKSPNWKKFHISAFDSPNFTGETVSDEIHSVLVTQEWEQEKRQEWGIESALYKSRVLGEFPEEGENQLISLSLCEEAQNRDIEPEGDKEMGLDIARFGDDLTVYTMKQGNVITDIQTEAKRDTMEVAGKAKQLYENEGISLIKVDEVGLGAGTVDRLKEQNINVVGINSGRVAREPDKYFNLRTELWFVMRDWLKTGKIPKHDLLVRDLTAPRYTYTSKGQYKLESKDETKKRLGRSPDYGDSAVLAIYKAIDKPKPGVNVSSTRISREALLKQMGVGTRKDVA